MNSAAGERRELEYAVHGGVSLKGHFYAPRGPGKFPFVIAVHGGGWRLANLDNYRALGPWLAERGYGVLAVTHRLSKPAEKVYPEAVQDVRAGLRGARSRAAMAPRPGLAAARPNRREVSRREPHRRPARLLRRFAAFLRLRQKQRHGVPARLGHRGRRRRSQGAKRGVPRGAEAGRALRALGGARRRAALLDRRPDRRAGKPVRILRAAAAALPAGALVMRAAALLLGLGFALSCAAQAYPSRAIRIVVAFPAGGGSDLAARVVGQK